MASSSSLPSYPPQGVLNKGGSPPAAERLARTFIDWYLLSLCHHFVIPGFSGYSRTAFAMALRRVAMQMENFEGQCE